jgi:hypothetical protein
LVSTRACLRFTNRELFWKKRGRLNNQNHYRQSVASETVSSEGFTPDGLLSNFKILLSMPLLSTDGH